MFSAHWFGIHSGMDFATKFRYLYVAVDSTLLPKWTFPKLTLPKLTSSLKVASTLIRLRFFQIPATKRCGSLSREINLICSISSFSSFFYKCYRFGFLSTITCFIKQISDQRTWYNHDFSRSGAWFWERKRRNVKHFVYFWCIHLVLTL